MTNKHDIEGLYYFKPQVPKSVNAFQSQRRIAAADGFEQHEQCTIHRKHHESRLVGYHFGTSTVSEVGKWGCLENPLDPPPYTTVGRGLGFEKFLFIYFFITFVYY